MSYPQKHPYGSVEYYADYFSDVIADAGDDNDPEAAHRILLAFREAVQSWLDYHNKYFTQWVPCHRIC